MSLDDGIDYPSSPYPSALVPPDGDPDDEDSITIRLSRSWLPVIQGACYLLVNPEVWKTDDPDVLDLTMKRAIHLQHVLHQPITEPPFYDDDETADDVELPVAPWYENVADWVISAFLATTFTPGAAIVYRATIPRLRLAFRTGDLGALVRVLLNDLEIWTGDTYAPTVGQLSTELDLERFADNNALGAPPWTLRIEHAGVLPGIRTLEGEPSTNKLEVELGDVRPRLSALALRQNGCVLETSTDGETWTLLYDPSDCVNGLVDDAITQLRERGEIEQPGGMQSPGEEIPVSTCRTYHVKLHGSDIWMTPVALSEGDSIEVKNIKGGWTDVRGLGRWYCGNGAVYALGECNESQHTTDENDPLPTAYHMQVIGLHNNAYFDALSIYTVQEGVDPLFVGFQANDSDIADNMGDIEFDVEICNHEAGWIHTFDFAVNNGGFVKFSGDGGNPGKGGVYRNGAWHSESAWGNSYCNFKRSGFAATHIIGVQVEGYATGPRGNASRWVNDHSGNDNVIISLPDVSGVIYANVTVDRTVTALWVALCSTANTGDNYVTKIIISGTGTDPFN